MSGTLFVVSSPIGNLKDITFRAIEVLKSVDLILAEDTRVTKKLLTHYEIDKPILSYNQHSSELKKLEIMGKLVNNQNLALLTDAGTPGISDPGNELISFLVTHSPEIKVVPIPGPSSLTAALSVCGFDVSKFLFLGFLPKKGLIRVMKTIAESPTPVVFFESPYRILKTLNLLESEVGDREIFIGRELTKIYETHYRGRIPEVRSQLTADKVKGEIVCILASGVPAENRTQI